MFYKNPDYLAHINKVKKETLFQHLDLTLEKYNYLNKELNLTTIFNNIQNILNTNFNLNQLVQDSIFAHDWGKINPAFQHKKLKNEIFKDKYSKISNTTNHSCLSSLLFLLSYYKDNCSDIDNYILLCCSYAISRHHSGLNSLEEFIEILPTELENNISLITPIFSNYNIKIVKNKYLKKLIDFIKKDKIFKTNTEKCTIYYFTKLVYSLICSTDSISTLDFMQNKDVKINRLKADFFKEYKNSKLYKSIKENDFAINDINYLRTQIFNETENNLLANLHENIYFLEAPTGSGKTNTSLNLAKILIENTNLNKIIYVFPFNTLVEQTTQSFSQYFQDDITVLNSLTEIKNVNKDKDEIEYTDLDLALIDEQMKNYSFLITSHVNLFNTLFGCTREENLALYNLTNSVIILDEIQTYNIDIWPHIMIMLEQFTKIFNSKIIIMSATLPQLDVFSNNQTPYTRLLKNTREYFQNPLFKNRVKINVSLLEESIFSLENLAEKILPFYKQNLLIELCTKPNVKKLYDILKEKINDNNTVLLTLTSNDNKYNREKIMSLIKNNHDKDINFILISTQIIEAGADIDMDVGFKEISLPDSEEQFLGRINRSCKKNNCECYFFRLTNESSNASLVYSKDLRFPYNIADKTIQKYFENKNFTEIYNYILNDLKIKINSHNQDNISEFYKYIILNNYKEINRRLQLLEEEKYSVSAYIPYILNIENEINLNGFEVWQEYIDLLNNKTLSYAEFRVGLSKIQSKMSYFTFQLRKNKDIIKDKDKIYGYYYIKPSEDSIYIQEITIKNKKIKLFRLDEDNLKENIFC